MKHVKIISLAVVIILVVGIISITFAKWSVKSEQKELNTLTVGCLETTIIEGESIGLTNLYPVTDQQGMNGKAYTFTLENTCDDVQKVQINLEQFATTNSFNASQMKYSLNDSEPTYINSLELMNPILDNATNGYVLITDELKPGVNYEYNLKMWIDENVTTEEGTNKIFKTRVSIITSYGK